MKYSIPREEVSTFDGQYKHESQIDGFIAKNTRKALASLVFQNRKGVFSEENFKSRFSKSGSQKVSTLEELGQAKIFFNSEARFFRKKTTKSYEFHLRGPNYLVALDSQFSVIQKLDILMRDINESVDYLRKYSHSDSSQHMELSPILDYLKNALVTLFNSFVHKEKTGQFELKNIKYQNHRQMFLEVINHATFAYYESLTNSLSRYDLIQLIRYLKTELINEISNTLTSEFRKFKFSSRSVVRPEASHPLVLLTYVQLISSKYSNSNLILGMPSGSTELASLIFSTIKRKFNNNKIQLALIPISLHSIKDTGNNKKIDYHKFHELLPPSENQGLCLIVDDNSASGRTIEFARQIVKSKYKGVKTICSVAEADTCRIKMNLKDKSKNSFSHPYLFKHSVNKLPVSKIIRPKFDFKEVYECRMLINYYMNKKSSGLADRIVNQVIADAIDFKIEDNIASFNNENSILKFKHTFLSNFYACPIQYEGRHHSSVEQAYLRQKFNKDQLKKMSQNQKHELNEILKFKGIIIQRNDFSDAFDNWEYPAGVLKRFSSELKKWGLEDPDWDQKRLKLMVELLIIKFTKPHMVQKLLETDDKYLIEGNEWNDTFWGVCKKRGRNYLGRIIMNIRSKLIIGEMTPANKQ